MSAHKVETIWLSLRVDEDKPVIVEQGEFLQQNEDLDPDDVADIKKMQPGDSLMFGGGAAPAFMVTRLP